jgi:predicted PhzF superfamily epimerase YddE/YHI9
MQDVAKELNQPTTAFINLFNEEYYLRWFTPSTEIPICGHGTLASSYYLWEKGFVEKEKPICYRTKSGALKAQFIDGWVQFIFPIADSRLLPTNGHLGLGSSQNTHPKKRHALEPLS